MSKELKLSDMPVADIKKAVTKVNRLLKIDGHHRMKKAELLNRIEKHPMISVVDEREGGKPPEMQVKNPNTGNIQKFEIGRTKRVKRERATKQKKKNPSSSATLGGKKVKLTISKRDKSKKK